MQSLVLSLSLSGWREEHRRKRERFREGGDVTCSNKGSTNGYIASIYTWLIKWLSENWTGSKRAVCVCVCVQADFLSVHGWTRNPCCPCSCSVFFPFFFKNYFGIHSVEMHHAATLVFKESKFQSPSNSVTVQEEAQAHEGQAVQGSSKVTIKMSQTAIVSLVMLEWTHHWVSQHVSKGILLRCHQRWYAAKSHKVGHIRLLKGGIWRNNKKLIQQLGCQQAS